MIRLPCRPSDPLNWEIRTEDRDILWLFDLGLDDPYFPISDEMRFQSLSLALTKFTQEIWPQFQERTKGAVLYRGGADFSAQFSWDARQKENWELWRSERPAGEETHLRRLFCADAFAHYFQLLAHKLPDELPLYLLLDGGHWGTSAERHQVVSKERFEHFHLAVKGLPHFNGMIWDGERIVESSTHASLAICFPEESQCSSEILAKLDRMMGHLSEPFRVIHEAFLTEEWEGVDVLHVLPEAMSSQGERKLMGFKAAGGIVVST